MTAASAQGASPEYFDKKGEINELRQLLRQVAMERDVTKKRDAIKKVIAYMTLGIDVSRLFPDMVMASATTDLVQKKMIYLYLTTYAEANGELALLAINTLQKDCRDDDPTIRGLALRSLCSLRLPNMLEYIEPQCEQGLKDPHGYVRKTAIMGALKIFHTSPANIRENDDILDRLYALVCDPDPHVAANALLVLEEVLADRGGMVVNRAVVTHLLNRVSTFSEHGQVTILKIVERYEEPGQAEMFDIMNMLEPLLKQSSASVTMATSHLFMLFTFKMASTHPELQHEVLARLKGPLLTLISTTTSQEQVFTVLSHIHALLLKAFANSQTTSSSTSLAETGRPDSVVPGWVQDYKQFFPKFNDSSYVKTLKLDILTLNLQNRSELLSKVVESNLEPVVQEMRVAVTDVSAEIARHAIRCLGRIAVNSSAVQDSMELEGNFDDPLAQNAAAVSSFMVQSLVDLLSLDIEYVTAETIVVLRDLLRKHPQLFAKDVQIDLEQVMERMETNIEGRASLIWLCGRFGESIDEAPYILENLVDTFGEQDPQIQIALVSALVRLFFARPGECQSMLGRLFEKVLSEDMQHVGVRDEGLFYYRLLQRGPEVAKSIVGDAQNENFEAMEAEEFGSSETREKIFNEFNTLSVLYNKPATRFLTKIEPIYKGTAGAPQGPHIPSPDGLPAPSGPAPETLKTSPVGDLDDMLGGGPGGPDLLGGGATMNNNSTGLDLLDSPPVTAAANPPVQSPGSLDDFLESSAPVSMGPASSATGFAVDRNAAELEPAHFEENWGAFPEVGTVAEVLPELAFSGELESLDGGQEGNLQNKLCAQGGLRCIASGFQNEDTLKFFLYAFAAGSGSLYLYELGVSTGGTVSCVVKSNSSSGGDEATRYLRGLLSAGAASSAPHGGSSGEGASSAGADDLLGMM